MLGTRAISIGTGAALAVIATVSVLTYRATERGVVAAHAAQQLAMARTVGVAIESELRGLAVSLRQFSSMPSVQGMHLEYIPIRIAAAFSEGAGAIQQIVRIDAEGRLYAWSLDGTVAAAGVECQHDGAEWAWLADRRHDGRVRVTPIWWDPEPPSSLRAVAVPVWRSSPGASEPVPPGTFNGILAYVVDVQGLVDAFVRSASLESLGGLLVVHGPEGPLARVAASEAGGIDPTAIIAGIPAGDGDGTHVRGSGEPVIAWAQTPIPGGHWQVTIATPYLRAAVDVRTTAGWQLATTTVLLVAVPIVAWAFVRRQRAAEEERRVLQAQLLQAQKMEAIGKLAGGVAHDFNNLLTAILGYTSMILEESGAGTVIHKGATQVRRAAESAATLTQKLLAFSRRQVLQPQRLDLGELLFDLQALLRRLLGEPVELLFRAGSDLWPVTADPVQIEQVIINLAVNARDAMPEGGRLVIAVENAALPDGEARSDHRVPPGEYVRVTVRDTGIGMDQATRARLFEPFFTTKPQGKGTGLGLPTVYGIVKQSGGFINVVSAPGMGTTVDLLFPRAAARAALRTATRATDRAPSGSETILLVEDDPAVRELTQDTLERHGYRVLAAGLPDEALAIAREYREPIQLMLSDVVMPGMLGPELARRVQEIRPDIRLLFMSGYAADAVSVDLLSDAALLQKPFSTVVLTRAVRLVLDAHHAPASA